MRAAAGPIVRGSLCVPLAPGSRPSSDLGQTDQIVAVLSDTNVARKRELEGAG